MDGTQPTGMAVKVYLVVRRPEHAETGPGQIVGAKLTRRSAEEIAEEGTEIVKAIASK